MTDLQVLGASASTAHVVDIVRRLLAHREKGVTVAHPDGPRFVSADCYRDPEVRRAEIEHLFRDRPLAVATTGDLRQPGAYVTRDLAGVPVVVVRDASGEVGAFLNSCVHRGIAVAQGDGVSKGRFVCRYHGWVYGLDGALVSVAQRDTFGPLDSDCHGLRRFHCEERHGLVFVQLNTDRPMDLSAHLGSFEPIIAAMGLDDMVCAARRQLRHEVNWKTALLGYYENYHVGFLHRDSIAPGLIPNLAVYERYGEHGVICWASKNLLNYVGVPESKWPALLHEHPPFHAVGFIFPNVVLNVFGLGYGQHMNLDFAYPGAHPGAHSTDWTLYRRNHDIHDPEQVAWADEHVARVFTTLEHEDYDTIVEGQRAVNTGLVDGLFFGANEAMLIDMSRAWAAAIGREPDDVPAAAAPGRR